VITGVIIPADWDQDGRIIAVSIFTHDEEEYVVRKRAKGTELVWFLQKEVEATGWAEVDEGKKMITIRDYRIRQRYL
jgi:hypothetical protein